MEIINNRVKILERKASKNVENTIVKIFGKSYKLNIKYKNIKFPELNAKKDDIEINLPNKYKKVEKTSLLNMLIEKMYEKIAENNIELIIDKVRSITKIIPEDYKIIKLKNTLGKCLENNTIIINPYIMMYKREVIEYIILHELGHIKYKNHTKKFWDFIDNYMPEHEYYEEEILEYKY